MDLPVNIVTSDLKTRNRAGGRRAGLCDVAGVDEQSAREILSCDRSSPALFWAQAPHRPIRRDALLALADAGAFSGFRLSVAQARARILELFGDTDPAAESEPPTAPANGSPRVRTVARWRDLPPHARVRLIATSARSELGGMSAMSDLLDQRFGIHVPNDIPIGVVQPGHEKRDHAVWKALPISWHRALLEGVFHHEHPDEREAQLDWLHANLAIEIPVEQLRSAAHAHQVTAPQPRYARPSVRPRRQTTPHERQPLIMRAHPHLDATSTQLAWERLSLRPWQAEALEWWQDRDCTGVVEAVTGAGKTRLAIAAILDSLEHGLSTLIIVPTIDLVRQWRRAIHDALVLNGGLATKIGVLVDGSADLDGRFPIVIATVHSVVSRSVEERAPFLLIADEAHRYGSERFAAALVPTERRLGLTATLERMDDGVEEHLVPYFGAGSIRVGYERALAERAIAPFRIAFVGVRFTAHERKQFLRWRDAADDARRALVASHDFPEEPFGEFMKLVSRAAEAPAHPACQLARRYLKAFQRTRAAMAEASGKLAILGRLTPSVIAASRSIVFANTVQASTEAARVLTEAGLSTGVLHAALDRDKRRDLLADFEDADEDITVLAAPRLLDEGVDVAAADLGIVLASSRSRRQMIQRMGRVIRPKPDGRTARFAIVYVENTPEDPATGSHETFLDEVIAVADEVVDFKAGSNADELVAFLSPDR